MQTVDDPRILGDPRPDGKRSVRRAARRARRNPVATPAATIAAAGCYTRIDDPAQRVTG